MRLSGPGGSITQPLMWPAASPGWTHPRVGAGDGPTTRTTIAAPGRRGGDTRPMERQHRAHCQWPASSLQPAAEVHTWSHQPRQLYPPPAPAPVTRVQAGHVASTLDTRAAVPSRYSRGCRAVSCRHYITAPVQCGERKSIHLNASNDTL